MTDLLDDLGAEVLGRAELEDLVHAIADRPDLWEEHVDEETTQRTYALLHRSAGVDVWVIVWRPKNDTGWHDHDVSSGAVRVVMGELVTHNLRVRGPDRRATHGPGSAFHFGPSLIHRMTCERDFAVSIHAYSPPLWRLGQYAVGAHGELQRTSVTYADELRPVEHAW